MPPSWIPLCRTMQVYCEPYFAAIERWRNYTNDQLLANRINVIESADKIFMEFSQNKEETYEFDLVYENAEATLLPEVKPSQGKEYVVNGDNAAFAEAKKLVSPQIFNRVGLFFQNFLLKQIAGHSDTFLESANNETRKSVIACIEKLFQLPEDAGKARFICRQLTVDGQATKFRNYPMHPMGEKASELVQYLIQSSLEDNPRKRKLESNTNPSLAMISAKPVPKPKRQKTNSGAVVKKGSSSGGSAKKKTRGELEDEEDGAPGSDSSIDEDDLIEEELEEVDTWVTDHPSVGTKVAAHFPLPGNPRKKQLFQGYVAKYAPPSKPKANDQLYHIIWEDGDEEDYEQKQLDRAIKRFNEHFECLKENHEAIGIKVAAYFEIPMKQNPKKKQNQLFRGEVTKVFPPNSNHNTETLYRISWEDGDEEDYDDQDLETGKRLYQEMLGGGTAAVHQKEEEEEEEKGKAAPEPPVTAMMTVAAPEPEEEMKPEVVVSISEENNSNNKDNKNSNTEEEEEEEEEIVEVRDLGELPEQTSEAMEVEEVKLQEKEAKEEAEAEAEAEFEAEVQKLVDEDKATAPSTTSATSNESSKKKGRKSKTTETTTSITSPARPTRSSSSSSATATTPAKNNTTNSRNSNNGQTTTPGTQEKKQTKKTTTITTTTTSPKKASTKNKKQQQEEPEEDEDDDWTEDHPSVGTAVAAYFPVPLGKGKKKAKNQLFTGKVTRYAPETKKGKKDQLYHVLFEDGDEQDYEEREFQRAVNLYQDTMMANEKPEEKGKEEGEGKKNNKKNHHQQQEAEEGKQSKQQQEQQQEEEEEMKIVDEETDTGSVEANDKNDETGDDLLLLGATQVPVEDEEEEEEEIVEIEDFQTEQEISVLDTLPFTAEVSDATETEENKISLENIIPDFS